MLPALLLLPFLPLLLLPCQRLDPEPRVAHPREPVLLLARSQQGKALAGVLVEVLGPDGSLRPAGTTDAQGRLTYVPEAQGIYEFRGQLPEGGPVIHVVYHVVPYPSPARWVYALLLTPLGLWLLWLNLRRFLRPEPSPPAP